MIKELFSKKRDRQNTGSEQAGIPKMIEESVASTYDDLMAIIEAKLELLKIDITEKIALIASLLILAIIILVACAYLVTTVALMIGELLGHLFLGYLIVSLFFIACFIFFTKIRPEFLKSFIQKILLTANDIRK
jgi:hypothetical protein